MIPAGFSEICEAGHPNDGSSGTLIRNRSTGIYALLVGGAVRSVPPKWARETAAATGGGTDSIQDICIARMESLQLNPNKVAEMLPAMSRTHVCDFLSRRKSMGSHKLQHLMAVLGGRIVFDEIK